ncbi:protein-L-isoaspartate(D-aspartate) O-methyltransferase [bacterium]|nr:protein-L-isoaspartate(D-aspartate) O-methyltransferase [bacterium]
MKEEFREEREEMVRSQIESRGIKDKRILDAMKKVPRHQFVPDQTQKFAYHDEPLPIGEGQTISQPYIIAYMTDVLGLKKEDKVLEIGTGSGYQAAILAEMVSQVFSIEAISSLSRKAQKTLEDLGYTNIYFKVGDGTWGWKEQAPYDAILVTAAPPSIPTPLQEQMREEGRMVLPVGETYQDLYLVVKKKGKFKKKKLLPVRFVPLIQRH